MTNNRRPRLISIGPTGIGYCCQIEEFPLADNGSFASHLSARLVWDSAAVAYLLGVSFESILLTNDLGIGAESERLRSFLKDRVHVVELGPRLEGCPFDIVLLERSTGTRRWISSRYGPTAETADTKLATLLGSPEVWSTTYLYIEAASPYLAQWIFTRNLFASAPAPAYALINFGDTLALGEREILSALTVTPKRSVLQWSVSRVLESSVTRAVAKSRIEKQLIAKGSVVLVTMGESGGVVATPDGMEIIRVELVSAAVTANAGGVVSASMLTGLAQTTDTPFAIANRALQAATAYVLNQTLSNPPVVNELELR